MTTLNQYDSPLQYFKPMVNHFLVMRSFDDVSPYSDSMEGSQHWFYREKEELENSLQGSSSTMCHEDAALDPDTINAMMASEVAHEEPEAAHEDDDLHALLNTIMPDDEYDGQVAIGTSETAVDVDSEPEISFPKPSSGFYNASFLDRDDHDEQLSLSSLEAARGSSSSSLKNHHEISVTPTLAALTALSLTKKERLELAFEKHYDLSHRSATVFPDLSVFHEKSNLEMLLRSFFALQSKFQRNVDSLDAFVDLDLIIRLVRLTPMVTARFYNSDSAFYEKWNFAVFLASRSFLHALYSCGFKQDTIFDSPPHSRVGKTLMLDHETSYYQFCSSDTSTWTCSCCNEVVKRQELVNSGHALPNVAMICKRQLKMSLDIKEEQLVLPASRCWICCTSLEDYQEYDNDDDDDDPLFRLRTFPYYNTLLFAQMACKCLKREYCIACLAELQLSANCKSDHSTTYSESDCWCLCLSSSAGDDSHFNVLTRGPYAASSVLTAMQLRLCYVWFQQMMMQQQQRKGDHNNAHYRNVMVMLYSPEEDEETMLTDCFGNSHVIPINEMCVSMDDLPADAKVTEMEFRMCLNADALVRSMEEDAEGCVSSEQGNRLRVLCCRVSPEECVPQHYLNVACQRVSQSLQTRPLLSITCTDNVLRMHSSVMNDISLAFHPMDDASPRCLLYLRCMVTGKMMFIE